MTSDFSDFVRGLIDGALPFLAIVAAFAGMLLFLAVVLTPVILLARWLERRQMRAQKANLLDHLIRGLAFIMPKLGLFLMIASTVMLPILLGWMVLAKILAAFLLIAPPIWLFGHFVQPRINRWRGLVVLDDARAPATRSAPEPPDLPEHMLDPKAAPLTLVTPAPAAHPGTSIAELATHLCDANTTHLTPAQAARLRPLLLHWLGLRTDLADASITEQAPHALRQRWFKLDLQHLDEAKDPRAALAFACLRVALYLRTAHLLGWLDNALYRTLTTLNTRRVHDSFADWANFVHACANGRIQWQAHGCTDIFGEHLSPDALRAYLWEEVTASGKNPSSKLRRCGRQPCPGA